MATYDELITKTSSRKILLSHVEPTKRLLLWTVHSGNIYKKTVNYYVIGLKEDDTTLTEAATLGALSAGEWFFEYSSKTLYVETIGSDTPQDHFMSATFRLFFSNHPFSAEHDLSTGNKVHYEERITRDVSVKQQIDPEDQTGIALESTTRISFENSDGFFDEIYDTYFFENCRVKIYSTFLEIPITESYLLFDGLVTSKSFNEKTVTFGLKDFLFKLREPVSGSLFTTSDGTLADSDLNTPKRIVYGKVDGLRLRSVDKELDGIDLTGTITINAGSTTVTGSGTSFLSEISYDDTLVVEGTLEEFTYNIESVESDTSLTLSEAPEEAFGGSAKVSPSVPYREVNRTWHVAGHKCLEPSTTVTTIIGQNRIEVADASLFEVNDRVFINSEKQTVRRISGNQIQFYANFQTTINVSDTVTKNPILKCFFTGERYKGRELILDRDFSVTNNANDCKIVFNNLAEFNITPTRNTPGTITFTNGSRDVSGTGVNFEEFLKPRDWIRATSAASGHTTWYEVLGIVDETNIKLRTSFAGGTTASTTSQYKSVEIFFDDSIVTVNLYGKENGSGEWVRTCPEVVKDLLNENSITPINASSFTEASESGFYTCSYTVGDFQASRLPSLRDVVADLNKSCFGNLYNSASFQISYGILDFEKPDTTERFNDSDILKFSVESQMNDIVRKANINYRHFDADKTSGESGNSLVTFESDFVDRLIGINNEFTEDVYLYEATNAQTICERYAFFYSLSQSIVKVDGKLDFMKKNLNDKLWFNLDRVYKRYGQASSQKLGVITSLTKSGENVSMVISDLGNIYSRAANITEDTAVEFSSADDSDKMINGYIVDNGLDVPDTSSEIEIGINLIS